MGGSPLVRTVKLRPPSPKCIACGPSATLKHLEEFDYDAFCSGSVAVGAPLSGVNRLQAKDFARGESKRLVIDTRPPIEYAICALPESTSEYLVLTALPCHVKSLTPDIPLAQILRSPESIPTAEEVVFVCRRGNDSLIAANALRTSLDARKQTGRVADVVGGLVAWSREVDPEFPVY